jgi:hypothetical protein
MPADPKPGVPVTAGVPVLPELQHMWQMHDQHRRSFMNFRRKCFMNFTVPYEIPDKIVCSRYDWKQVTMIS